MRFIKHLRRSGEFVLQRMFLEDGQGNKSVVLADLIRVPNNTGETHFECFRRLMPYCRSVMTSGILVEAYCWDGVLFFVCSRLHRQFLACYHHQLRSHDENEGGYALNELTHWFVSMRCVMHLAHGGLTRGIQEFFEDRAILKNGWVTLESLRSSLGQLIRCGRAWINARVAFGDWELPLQDQEALWRTLGMETEVVDSLVDLQLRWDVSDSKLKVASRHLDSPTPTGDVLSCLKCAWRF